MFVTGIPHVYFYMPYQYLIILHFQ